MKHSLSRALVLASCKSNTDTCYMCKSFQHVGKLHCFICKISVEVIEVDEAINVALFGNKIALKHFKKKLKIFMSCFKDAFYPCLTTNRSIIVNRTL